MKKSPAHANACLIIGNEFSRVNAIFWPGQIVPGWKMVQTSRPRFWDQTRLPESDAGIFWISGNKERQTSGRLYPYGLSAMGGVPPACCWFRQPICATLCGLQRRQGCSPCWCAIARNASGQCRETQNRRICAATSAARQPSARRADLAQVTRHPLSVRLRPSPPGVPPIPPRSVRA